MNTGMPVAIHTLDDQRRLVAALCKPDQHPDARAPIQVIETHISFVILDGHLALKLKKPLDLGFVDFSTLERRRFFCEEELRLNRRNAPQLYLGIATLTGSVDAPRFDREGPVLDYAVRMRQFDQTMLFDHLLARGQLSTGHIEALADAAAALHASAARAGPGDAFGTPQAVRAPVVQNFEQLRALLPTTGQAPLDVLERWSEAEYARLEDHLAQRRRDGHVRECHGDLHLGNVVLIDGRPTMSDCIEFNPAFRWSDVTADIAFMAMDLGRRGRPDLAARFINRYAEASGDYAGLAGLRFYLVYRAMVRAKVAAIRAAQPGATPDDAERARAECADYLAWAQTASAGTRPVLLLTHGLSGSGKSRLARHMVDGLGAICLRSDVIRKRLHGLAPLAASGSTLSSGLYQPQATDATYAALLAHAQALLAAGLSVIVDATFLKHAQRLPFRRLAEQAGVPWLILDCRAPVDVLRGRIDRRRKAGKDASEADTAVLELQLGLAEPLDADEAQHALRVDSTGYRAAEVLRQVRALAGMAGA
jgi:aminoglycoside phosphotransferase family enzyme/predicted kinase